MCGIRNVDISFGNRHIYVQLTSFFSLVLFYTFLVYLFVCRANEFATSSIKYRENERFQPRSTCVYSKNIKNRLSRREDTPTFLSFYLHVNYLQIYKANVPLDFPYVSLRSRLIYLFKKASKSVTQKSSAIRRPVCIYAKTKHQPVSVHLINNRLFVIIVSLFLPPTNVERPKDGSPCNLFSF